MGHWGEDMAEKFLKERGYRILDRNWRLGHRDLDLVAVDADELVIVEVKTRQSGDFLAPELAVNKTKIRNLRIAADAYIRQKQIDMPARFDIITITGSPEGYEVDHIERAFLPY